VRLDHSDAEIALFEIGECGIWSEAMQIVFMLVVLLLAGADILLFISVYRLLG
jgi:hypothetical protein